MYFFTGYTCKVLCLRIVQYRRINIYSTISQMKFLSYHQLLVEFQQSGSETVISGAKVV